MFAIKHFYYADNKWYKFQTRNRSGTVQYKRAGITFEMVGVFEWFAKNSA